MVKTKEVKGFTLIELLVVISVIAVLMAILMPALKRAREQGKRAVCQSSLKQLQMAWIMYASENNSRIVSGDAGFKRNKEWYWIGRCWKGSLTTWYAGDHLPEEEQFMAIKEGALWNICNSLKAYKCPTGVRGEEVTYAIGDSMNGHPRSEHVGPGKPQKDNLATKGNRIGKTQLYVKKLDEIISPAPALRMVFIDEGIVPVDSWAMEFKAEQWWDAPTARHGHGTNLSFADGHVEYRKWKDSRSKEAGDLMLAHEWTRDTSGQYSTDNEDLDWMHRVIWGVSVK